METLTKRTQELLKKINDENDGYRPKNDGHHPILTSETTYDDDVIRNDDIISSFDGKKSSNSTKSFTGEGEKDNTNYDITREWNTIKTEDEIEVCKGGVSPHRGTRNWGEIRYVESKSNPFGSWENPRTNVWNHEWTSQFRSYQREHKGERPEEVIQNEEWMMEELVPLFKKENPNWKTCEETQDRLLELIGECRKNETEY